MDKHARLLELAKKRQRDSSWRGYGRIGDYHGGVYECDHVSPYTKSAGNVDAKVFVLLQDWASHDWLNGQCDLDAVRLGRKPSLATNRNLDRLLALLGVDLGEAFATNLFPFIKCGDLSAPLPMRDLLRAAREYAIPQVEIVAPQLVVCLGVQTFNALRIAAGLRRTANTQAAIDSPFELVGASVWCQAHTGALGQKNRNRDGVDRVSSDWIRMRAELEGFASRSVV